MKSIVLLAFCCITFRGLSQDQVTPVKNSFGLTAGYGRPNKLATNGGGSYDGNSREIGLNYYYQLSPGLKFETGLLWHGDRYKTSSDNPPFTSSFHTTSRIYIPVFLRFRISNTFYFHFGVLTDKDLQTDPSVKKQFGYGAGLGIGAEVPVSKGLVIQINPYLNGHSLSTDNKLFDAGIKLGIRTR